MVLSYDVFCIPRGINEWCDCVSGMALTVL